jgi:GxxExxY protein
MLHEEITGAIIGSFYEVHNTLGVGFLEKVYENALTYLLRQRGLTVIQQAPIAVYFQQVVVGNYVADLLVDEKVIVELKTADQIHPEHLAQLSNYLKATQIEVGLLLNFGRRTSFKRVILTNDRKLSLGQSKPSS